MIELSISLPDMLSVASEWNLLNKRKQLTDLIVMCNDSYYTIICNGKYYR